MCQQKEITTLKLTTMTIKTATFYNGAVAKLTINLSNGKTMSANVLDSDKIKYLKNDVSINELVEKYYSIETRIIYANPTK